MDLREAVISALGERICEHGFEVVEACEWMVILASERLRIRITLDPRGEVEVRAFRPGLQREGVWSYTGMIGRASLERLLEIASERLAEDSRILTGDDGYYESLDAEQNPLQQRWNYYYQGKGPQPRGRLP